MRASVSLSLVCVFVVCTPRVDPHTERTARCGAHLLPRTMPTGAELNIWCGCSRGPAVAGCCHQRTGAWLCCARPMLDKCWPTGAHRNQNRIRPACACVARYFWNATLEYAQQPPEQTKKAQRAHARNLFPSRPFIKCCNCLATANAAARRVGVRPRFMCVCVCARSLGRDYLEQTHIHRHTHARSHAHISAKMCSRVVASHMRAYATTFNRAQPCARMCVRVWVRGPLSIYVRPIDSLSVCMCGGFCARMRWTHQLMFVSASPSTSPSWRQWSADVCKFEHAIPVFLEPVIIYRHFVYRYTIYMLKRMNECVLIVLM